MDQPRGNTRSTRSLSPAPRQYDAGWAGERKATTQVNTAFTCAQVRPELTWASGVPGSDVHWPSARTENRLAGIILPIILCARCSMPGSDIGDCAARRKQRTTAQAVSNATTTIGLSVYGTQVDHLLPRGSDPSSLRDARYWCTIGYYARAMRCPVLTRGPAHLSQQLDKGDEILVSADICLRAAYAMSGTDIAVLFAYKRARYLHSSGARLMPCPVVT
eukprot:1524158-Rhodomonas_salina.3